LGNLVNASEWRAEKEVDKGHEWKTLKRPVTDENNEMIFKLNTMSNEVDGCPMSEVESKARRFILSNATKGRSKATIT